MLCGIGYDDTFDVSGGRETRLHGGTGGDSLVAGGASDDTLTGGHDDDAFPFADGDGADAITDLVRADDDTDGATTDPLDLSALANAHGNTVEICDVVVGGTVGEGSGDAIWTFPDGENLTLTGVDPAALDASMMQAMGSAALWRAP